jgi:hypothetical protein
VRVSVVVVVVAVSVAQLATTNAVTARRASEIKRVFITFKTQRILRLVAFCCD